MSVSGQGTLGVRALASLDRRRRRCSLFLPLTFHGDFKNGSLARMRDRAEPALSAMAGGCTGLRVCVRGRGRKHTAKGESGEEREKSTLSCFISLNGATSLSRAHSLRAARDQLTL